VTVYDDYSHSAPDLAETLDSVPDDKRNDYTIAALRAGIEALEEELVVRGLAEVDAGLGWPSPEVLNKIRHELMLRYSNGNGTGIV
jgi:hypothetical protein